jgi:hypothetical protein
VLERNVWQNYVQAAATPVEGQRAGLPTRPRSYAALSGVESSGLVTLTESAEDAAGADDAEMEEEVVGAFPPMLHGSLQMLTAAYLGLAMSFCTCILCALLTTGAMPIPGDVTS